MDQQLLGYLLDTLEPDEHREVERQLHDDPELRQKLDRLRQSLAPLSADKDAIEPPPQLWVRAIARVAEYQCQRGPATLPLPPAKSTAVSRGGWRRPDVVAAAAILFGLLLLIPPGITYLRHRYEVTACQNNLRGFYNALVGYSEIKGGKLPDVADPQPWRAAGLFVPMLNENRLLPDDVTVICPATGRQPPTRLSLQDVENMPEDLFKSTAPALAGRYAYTLGYQDDLGHHGLRTDDPNKSFTPVMADCPPSNVESSADNSPNHGGSGQNILFVDGHCSWWTTRRPDSNTMDDIYLNSNRKVASGIGAGDAVLGRSDAEP